MSDKKLLEEGTIRRFQMLANIKPVNSEVLEEGSKKKSGQRQVGGMSTEKREEYTKKGNMEEAKHAKHGKKPAEHMEEESLEETLEEKYVEEGGLEEMYKEAGVAEEGTYEEGAAMEEAEEGGDEGGDVRSALQDIEAGVNKLLGMIEGGEGLEVGIEEPEGEEGMGGGASEMGAPEELDEEESLMEAIKTALSERKKAKGKHDKASEELDESIELVDDDVLAEELTQRVAARLVAEMKKAKKMVKEGSKGGAASVKAASGTNKPTPKAKKPTGHGPGKGTPFGGKKK